MNRPNNTSATTSMRPSSDFQNMIIMCATLGCISLIGLVGNCVVIIISKRLRSQNFHASVLAFIFHLALSDLLVCGVCIPLTISANFINMDSSSPLSQTACKVLRYFQFLPPTLSITILTTVSIDRYFALVKPLTKYSFVRRPGRMVTFAWLYSIVIFLPTVFLVKVINIPGKNFGYCTTTPYNSQTGFGFLMFVAVFAFLLPLAIMFFMYFNIVRVVWFRKKTMNDVNSSASGEVIFKRSKKKVLKLFFRVILVFLICWLPFVIYGGFIEMYTEKFPNPGDMIRISTYFLGLFNSLCNPFVYFFSNKAFRNACVDLFCCRIAKFSQNTPNTCGAHCSSPSFRNRLRSLASLSSGRSVRGRTLTLSTQDCVIVQKAPPQVRREKRGSSDVVSN